MVLLHLHVCAWKEDLPGFSDINQNGEHKMQQMT